MAGLTPEGLEIKRLSQVREDLRRQAIEFFNDLVPTGDVLDTSSSSTLGRLIGLVSPSETDLWEALQEVYLAFDPNSAEGIALDNLVSLSGIVRRGASSTTARVLLTGDYTITISESSLVSSSFTNNRFGVPFDLTLNEDNAIGFTARIQTIQNSANYTVTYSDGTNSVDLTYTSTATATEGEILQGLADVVNNNYGSILNASVSGATLNVIANDLVTQSSYSLSSNLFFSKITKGITVVCTEVGPIEQNSGTIDTISTPIFGWDSVEQFEPAVTGSLRESDISLRRRFSAAKYTRGSNILDALYSDLISLDGVQNVTIYENVTNQVDAKGIPPHAFMVLIRGGLEQEVAEAIWRNRPAGITTHGNSTYLITDVFGNLKEVYFQRPTFVDIYVSATITTDEDFPTNGFEEVRSALFDYVQTNARVGENVIYSRLYTPLNSVPGHQVDSLQIGFTANPTGTSNLTLNYDEIAKLEIGNIEVDVL